MERPRVFYMDKEITQQEVDHDFNEGIRIIDRLNDLIQSKKINGLAQWQIADLCHTDSKVIGRYLARKVNEKYELETSGGLYYCRETN